MASNEYGAMKAGHRQGYAEGYRAGLEAAAEEAVKMTEPSSPERTRDFPPLNGTKTHPLSEHAMAVLRSLLSGPIPRQRINPGVVNRLHRGRLVDSVTLPSPFSKRKGLVEHLRINDAGRAMLAASPEADHG